MRTTTDTYTGKRFRWNTTVAVETEAGLVVVPSRLTKNDSVWLHPNRVPAALLAELNPKGGVS